MTVNIFLYDDGIYTKEHFRSNVADTLKRTLAESHIDAEIIIEKNQGTSARDWLQSLKERMGDGAVCISECRSCACSDHAYAVYCAHENSEHAMNNIYSSLGDIHCDMDAADFVHNQIIRRYAKLGVEFIDGKNTYIDNGAKIASGVRIYPNVYIEGDVTIDEGTVLYPGCRIEDSRIGKNCTLEYVKARDAVVGDSVSIGPYVNLRPGTVIAPECKIGDFVEVKNSNVGRGTKLPHLSYIGDADVGERVNVGCGTVFVNYDGKNKHRSTVGNDVFLGCNTNLVAPVSVEDGAYTAAGSTVTDDVPKDTLAIARARQVNKENWIPPRKR